MRLLPKQEKFFDFLIAQADLVARAGALLAESAASPEAGRVSHFEKIRQLEAEGDGTVLEVYRRLGKTFLTPIDAEDIHLLASELDDILDGLEEASYRLAFYKLNPVPETVMEMSRVIERACKEVHKAVQALANDDQVLEHCLEINRCEDQMDRMLRDSLCMLFEAERDAISLIKIKEVMEILEDTVDRCQDVSASIQNIVIKNG